MSSESPAAIFFSSDGYELAVINGNAIPANTRGLLTQGSDGTNSHFFSVDSSGRQVIVGIGTAGTSVGGILSVQGVAGGVAIPVSGTFTSASASTTATAVPGSATLSGASVSTTVLSGLTSGDMYALSMTTAGLLRVDGSNVIQPVSGTITANAGTGTFTISGTVAATQSGTWTNTVSQATAASLNATVIGTTAAGAGASAGLITIQGNASGTAVPVSGIITANAGTGNFNVLGTGSAGTAATGVITVQGIAGGVSLPVSLSKSSTGTLTSVAGAIGSTSLLASNANRISATFFNDSTSIAYIALNAVASTTSFTIKLLPSSYWELPIDYTGAISGIWASATGSMRISELT